MTTTPAFLDGERLVALLTPAEALAAVQGFFATHGPGDVEAPPRIHMAIPGRNTTGLYMPAATREFAAVKIVHLMPHRFPSVEAEVFLYDAESGKLLFWGDGKPMTALRTAAVSTAATLRLMSTCGSLLVFGAGVQAGAHVQAFASAYPGLETVWAATRSPESFARLEASLAPDLRPALRHCENSAAVRAALGEVDCIVATTPAPDPLFDWAALGPRCHVVGIGSATHDMNELPPEAFLRGSVWVDTRNALREAGDFRAALAKGWDEASLRGDLFDLLGGETKDTLPTQGNEVRTVFKSVGHAAQDLAILIRLWEMLNG